MVNQGSRWSGEYWHMMSVINFKYACYTSRLKKVNERPDENNSNMSPCDTLWTAEAWVISPWFLWKPYTTRSYF